MTDVVVTLPKSFGLKKWIDEGDAAGDPPESPRGRGDGKEKMYYWTVANRPNISPGDRVYIVYKGHLIGYAPLVSLGREIYVDARGNVRTRFKLWRKDGAQAVTINEYIKGFQGYRYRWWDRSIERPFPDWKEKLL